VGGILVARLWVSGRLRATPLHFLICLALAALAWGVAWNIYWSHANYWDNWRMVTFWRTSLAFATASTVACLVTLPLDVKHWSTLPLRLVNHLGEVSYGLYLWHIMVVLTLMRHFGLREWHLLIGTLGISYALAVASWYGFERWASRKARAAHDQGRWAFQPAWNLLGRVLPAATRDRAAAWALGTGQK
jgi:peptidoglycan/LPS O-acetylase OafA/YrhL